jgi:hypothetical protein
MTQKYVRMPLRKDAQETLYPAPICFSCVQRSGAKNRVRPAETWGHHVHPKTRPSMRVRTLDQMMKGVCG